MTELKVCGYLKCDNTFEPAKHNQKYCIPEHGILENNRKGMEAYHNKKNRSGGPRKICATPGCGTLLSIYNTSEECAVCAAGRVEAQRAALIEALNGSR